MKVTIIIPWIRKDKIDIAIAAAIRNAGVEVLVNAQEDRERIGCPKMVKAMVDYIPKDTDYVCFLGDDTIAAPNYIKIALDEMSVFPDNCGMIGFNDKSGRFGDGKTLANHWIAHIDLLPLLGGEFFHTGYVHSFCDNELQERLTAIGRYRYSESAIVMHDHPMITGGEWDDDYKRVYSEEVFNADKELFIQRKKNGWKKSSEMKILVCGNGPTVPKQLQGRTLEEFDKIVRINDWKSIEGFCNRCDVWVFYPHHHPQYKIQYEFDFTPYLNLAKEFWIVHGNTIEMATKIIGREPEEYLTDVDVMKARKEIISIPSTGVLALYLARKLYGKVYAAGFDFYTGKQDHYYDDVKHPLIRKGNIKRAHPLSPHDFDNELIWYKNCVKEGSIIEL